MRIGIAGAGLAGRLLALRLGKQHEVSLFDKDARGGQGAAGFTAAGMLAPYAELETAESEIFELGYQSLALWPTWLEALDEKVDYEQQGSVVIAHAPDMSDLNQFVEQLRCKVPNTYKNRIVDLDKAALHEREPELQSFQRGYYLKDEAHLNTQQFMQASETTLCHAGVNWHYQHTVNAVEQGTIVANDQTHRFDWVFDTRGLGSKPDIETLRGVRGEILTLYAPDVTITRAVRLMHPRYRIYIVPRANHHYVVGATEIESDDMSPLSVRSSLELLSAAYSLHSGFGEARIVDSRVNCRPAMPDNLPYLEEQDGLTRINGLYRHGYLLAPALIEKATEQLLP